MPYIFHKNTHGGVLFLVKIADNIYCYGKNLNLGAGDV